MGRLLKPMDRIRPEFTDLIPSEPAEGVLYISEKYSTAVHLCCCGCKSKVVTPLKPYAWRLTKKRGAVTLRPSIGSWSLPCKSHYWISNNQVEWATGYSAEEIEEARASDRDAQHAFFETARPKRWRERIFDWWKR